MPSIFTPVFLAYLIGVGVGVFLGFYLLKDRIKQESNEYQVIMKTLPKMYHIAHERLAKDYIFTVIGKDDRVWIITRDAQTDNSRTTQAQSQIRHPAQS